MLLGLIKINLVTLSGCSFGQYEASLNFASIRTYVYVLDVDGAYSLICRSVGVTDDYEYRRRMFGILDDFSTENGLTTH